MGTKRQRTENTNTNANGNYERADAFLRVYLVDAEGNKHRLPKDMALYLKNNVSAAMISKAQEDGEFEFTLAGSINIVNNEPKDIKL